MQRTLDLTQSQLLLWTGQQLNPESPLYNMAFVFELPETIEIAHFRAAFQKIIEQSDALRTIFVLENGVPKQQVLPSFSYEIELLDWTEQSDAEANFWDWAKKRAQQAFALDNCLFDSVLIQIADKKYYWFFNEHHLITDAWTSTLIYNTLASYYQKSVEGKLTEVEGLHQFQEYIEYEQLARSNPKKQHLHEHWKKKAKGIVAPPSLYGYPRLEAGTHSERVLVDLGKERSQKLRMLALEKDLRSWTVHSTLFNLFSTALFTYLYRVSGQQQLAIGTPAHNRVTKEFKETIGVFIELFPLMTKIEEKETFLSLFKKVRTEVNEFLRHAQPGTSTAELHRGFNVVLNYIHAQFKDFNGIPTHSKWLHAG
ncbi:MAG: condensation domain-containing protein, partial [Bacteroidota bacterium]